VTADVQSLDDFRKTRSGVTGTAQQWSTAEAAVVRIDEIDGSTKPESQSATAAALYPNIDEKNSTLSLALALLKESDGILDEAARFADEDEMMSADDAIQRFTTLLPELFMCRSLGDSFATVILALFHGIRNLKGLPATPSQIGEIHLAVRRLVREPFLVYTEALKLTSKLELSGMTIDPASLSIIGEFLVD
jgi:hypothetical protein